MFIDATAEVHPDAVVGDGTRIWNWTKVREGASIGLGCNIGQCVYVDRDVSIGSFCKVQNGVSLYRGLTVGDKVFIGPSATFVNDLLPRSDADDWTVVSTQVLYGASIGANATILCGLTLGRNCLVGAGAVVTRDVPHHGLVVGNPARLIDYVSASGNRLFYDVEGLPPPPELLIHPPD